MRRIALIALVLAAGAATFVAAAVGDTRTYTIEMYNAFGVVEGSDVRIAGVNAGSVQDLEINEAKRAVVTVELSGPVSELGTETECSSEPQSLIAEYFIDCQPKGPPISDGGDPQNPDVPADRVSQTVQPDLVQSTLREPFKRRFQLLINEFGTALAGNPENLNEAIRLGAPALSQLERVLRIMAQQNRIIRDLNVNSDRIMARLAERREDVVRFIQESRDTARTSAERRADLSRNFEILDDFLAELRPTLAEVENAAREQTPLLRDLRAAAPGLNRFALTLPDFNEASEVSLESLGEAGVVGRRALRRGHDEVRLLARAGRRAPRVGEMLADFLRDLDDPRRAVEINERARRDTGRSNSQPNRRDTMGYTGLEGLLNYVYYQAGAINQFDEISHLLHFNLYDIQSGPCGAFFSGRAADDDEAEEAGVEIGDPVIKNLEGELRPARSLSFETDGVDSINRCYSYMGPNIPGLTEDLDLPRYHPSVCPDGTEPERARRELCDPGGAGTQATQSANRSSAGGEADGEASASGGGGSEPAPEPAVPGSLEDLLDLPRNQVPRDVRGLRDRLRGLNGGAGGRNGAPSRAGKGNGGNGGSGDARAAEDLLDFLFGS
jgi:ABC-type transporter Mla subunit MlaD